MYLSGALVLLNFVSIVQAWGGSFIDGDLLQFVDVGLKLHDLVPYLIPTAALEM